MFCMCVHSTLHNAQIHVALQCGCAAALQRHHLLPHHLPVDALQQIFINKRPTPIAEIVRPAFIQRASKGGGQGTFSWMPFRTSPPPGDAAAVPCCPTARISWPRRCGAQSVWHRHKGTQCRCKEVQRFVNRWSSDARPEHVRHSMCPAPVHAGPHILAQHASASLLRTWQNGPFTARHDGDMCDADGDASRVHGSWW